LLDINQLAVFFLVLARLSTFLAVGPVFSMPNIPGPVKVGLSFAVAVIVFPLVEPPAGINLSDGWLYVFAIIQETMVGLVLGFTANLILSALVFAGSLMDMHIGFMASSMFDPLSGATVGILARFMQLLGLAALLGFNGHHVIIAALVRSYTVVPVGAAQVNSESALFLIKVSGQMIGIGVQIAAPLIAVMLIIDVTLGLLARTTPQINVFMLGFPIKIIFGLLVISVLVPVLTRIIYSLVGVIEKDMFILLKGMT